MCQEWQNLCEELVYIITHEIPRFIGSPKEDWPVQLLCFTDASIHVYGVVVYVRFFDGSRWTTKLVFSKAKVAPQSGAKRSRKTRGPISIPRLELLAILIGVRAVTFVEEQIHIPITQIFLWSDSMIALSWLRCTKPLKVFVRNRVQEIKQKASNVDFRYVNTKENPADKMTRGENAKSLIDDSNWWNGPSWLKESQSEWPHWDYPSFTTEASKDFDDEIASSQQIQFQVTEIPESSPYGTGLQVSRFSKLKRLIRVSAWVEKAIKRMRRIETSTDLQPSDITSAHMRWLRFIQSEGYKEELSLLKSDKCNKLIRQLNLKISDDGLMISIGRLQNADVPESARQPILLPNKHPFTRLVIMDEHEAKGLHPGTSQVLCKLRESYWIPKGRITVQSVLRSCYLCRKHHGGPFKISEMAPLPTERVSRSPPFVNTGVDYFGPILVKDVENEKHKTWICLLTCMVTRAIHLEVVEDMTTISFIRAFRRFLARRGTPAIVYSDNAKQFKLASDLLKDLRGPEFNEEITTYMTSENITWKFIPEKSPWFGGFYERMVSLVKGPLRKIIGKGFPCLDELRSAITEIEALVNSRPLVYVDADRDSPHTITPKDFLSLNPKTGVPFISTRCSAEPVFNPLKEASTIHSLWETGNAAVDEFWKLWHAEYLLSLRERYKILFKTTTGEDWTNKPYIGTVVLVKDDNLRRGQWRLGRITEIIKSRDSEPRIAIIRMPNGHHIRRAIKLLYPIETSLPDELSESNPESQETNTERSTQPDLRQERKSKLKAKEQLARLFPS